VEQPLLEGFHAAVSRGRIVGLRGRPATEGGSGAQHAVVPRPGPRWRGAARDRRAEAGRRVIACGRRRRVPARSPRVSAGECRGRD
jgi:hypothetical protein